MEAETEDLPRQAHWLKVLVIGMSAFLMLTSLVLVVVGIQRLGKSASDNKSATQAFASLRHPLPAGCRIEQMSTADGRLVLSIGGRDACRRVVVLDLKSGAVLGEIEFPTP